MSSSRPQKRAAAWLISQALSWALGEGSRKIFEPSEPNGQSPVEDGVLHWCKL